MTQLNAVWLLPTDKGFYRKVLFFVHMLVTARRSPTVNSVWREAGNTNEQLKMGNASGIAGRWFGQSLRGLR